MGLQSSTDAFAPIRGFEETILEAAVEHGRVYFSLDTNNVFFDAGGKHHQVNGAGITFVYGNATGEGAVPFDSDLERYFFSRDKIVQNHNVTDCYLVGDIIINADGTFYKIEEITEEFCLCTKMLVAGTGGGSGSGGGGSSLPRWLLAVENKDYGYTGLPMVWPYGSTIEGFFKISSESMGQTANIFVKVKDEFASEQYRESASQSFGVSVGENFKISFTKDHLVPGKNNYIEIQAEVNGELTNKLTYVINYLDMQFDADSTWDTSAYKTPAKGVTFPFIITSKSTDLSQENINVSVVYSVDNLVSSQTYQVTSVSGTHVITNLFEQFGQGGHVLRVKATTEIGGQIVTIGDLTYGIGWYLGEEKAFIWSNYNNTEENNYDIIRIPYWAFDPKRKASEDAVIQYYINDEEITEEIIPAQTLRTWEIETYIPQQVNVFKLICDDYVLEFEVYIKRREDGVSLESYSDGCELYLTAKGRSNNEPIAKRSIWKNQITNSSTVLNVGEPELKNFNWYNNGWYKADDGMVLRVSNGARVEIPMNALFGPDNRTFEFDFKINNPVDYSKLITITQTGETVETDKFTGATIVTPILTSTIDSNPHAFLEYCSRNENDGTIKQGIVLGTQEAAFALGLSELTSVRYADGNRIKISIVVDAKGSQGQVYEEDGKPTMDGETPVVKRLVYLYVNGVISGLLQINDPNMLQITNANSKLIINSDYCDVDIYGIRVYNNGLTYAQIAQNWIGDASTLSDKLLRYYINQNILTQGKIDYRKVMNLKKTLIDNGFSEEVAAQNSIPVMIIKTYLDNSQGITGTDDMLPYAKGNKKCVAVRYYDPNNPDACFHGQNLELDVQGTSSQGYPRRNYKLKTSEFNKNYMLHPYHFQKWDGLETNKDVYKGEELEKINIGYGDGSLKEKAFCFKADYMESSSTHNTGFANLIGRLSVDIAGTAYDFRHPLVKDFELNNAKGYRTTVYGFPMVIFHENQAGEISFVGKYNFNIDKGATGSFGFSDKTVNKYSAVEKQLEWVEEEPDTYIMTNKDKDEWLVYTDEKQGTFKQLSECWEFTQNQAGIGKFTGAKNAPLAVNDKGKLSIFDHFEARYHIADFEDGKDLYEMYSNPGEANAIVTPFLKNFMEMWNWVNSTDTDSKAVTNANLSTAVYYTTLDSEYVEGREYYEQPGLKAQISIEPKVTYDKIENEQTDITEINANKFFQAIKTIKEVTELDDCVGVYSFFLEDNSSRWYFLDPKENVKYYLDEDDFGFVVPEGGLYVYDSETQQQIFKQSFSIELSAWAEGFTSSLLEKHTVDNARYRLAKFKNEFSLHFDINYSLIYFILTELLLAYDSRQKNMMLASYGPRKSGGCHIWYPIFYDIDTQLGVNNSGQIYWDYDTDATPLDINPETGRLNDSIFSGNGSVLWYNFALCFKDQIIGAYRALRNSELNIKNLEYYYNQSGCDKWSNTFKNIDADYKYLAPATTGFTDQSGAWDKTAKYYYCLQGDRKLSRTAFFRNRLNYIDSQWQGGDYDPNSTKGQIKMRYNANDLANTSDNGNNTDLDTNLDFTITPFLSQYVSVIFDEAATNPIKYDLTKPEEERTVVVEPIPSIKSQLNDGYALSQQLIYIRGPQYISDFGDLSLKYLNEFDCTPAIRLRRLQLGNTASGYFNKNLASKDFELDSAAGSKNAKTLLEYLDLSQLSQMGDSLDVGGCAKLQVIKLMGTMIPYTVLPKGNVLKQVYFPASTEQLNLINPLVLDTVITDPAQLANDVEGLYIDNLTNVMYDRLNPDIGITDSCYTIIKTLEIEKDLFGLDSYRMLKYLYTVKKAVINNTYAATSTIMKDTVKDLSIKLTEVNWSPYIQVDKEAEYSTSTTYYTKVNGVAYAEFSGDLNQWIIERDDSNLFIYNANIVNQYPITDVEMLNYFKQQHEAPNSAVPLDKFYFKSTVISSIAGTKLLPVITGRMHVKNTNSINEADLYKLVSYFNNQNKNFGNLEITVDQYTPSYSAEFIEYLPDGTRMTHGWHKTASGTDNVVYPNASDPVRMHYEFAGWTYDDGNTYRNACSVIDDSYKGDLFQTWELANLKYSDANNQRYTFVALYKLRGYNITYQVGDTLFKTIVVPANQKIVAPTEIPYLDDTVGYDLYTRNHFKGWTNIMGSDTTIDVTTITATGPATFYAVFQEESVYDHPVDSKYLIATENRSNMTCAVGLNPAYGLKGKICIPKEYVNDKGEIFTITDIGGDTLAGDTNGFANNPDIFAVFFKGMEDKEKTTVIRSLGAKAFQECGLVHIDFPPTLTSIGTNCFSDARYLQFYDLSAVRAFGQGCFARAGYDVVEANTLIISPQASFGSAAFNGCGHTKIQIGSRQDPMTSTSALYNTNYSNGFLGTSDMIMYDWKLQSVIVYHDMSITPTNANNKAASLVYHYGTVVTEQGFVIELEEV